jgi:hypothetical protein
MATLYAVTLIRTATVLVEAASHRGACALGTDEARALMDDGGYTEDVQADEAGFAPS